MSSSPEVGEGFRPGSLASQLGSTANVIQWLASDLAAEPAPLLAVAADWLATRLPDYAAFARSRGDDPDRLSATLVDTALAALQSEDELALYEYWDTLREVGRHHSREGYDMETMLAVVTLHRDLVVEVLGSMMREVGVPDRVLTHARHRLDLLIEKLTVSLALGYVDSTEERYQEQRAELQALMAITRSVNRSLELPDVAEAGLRETLRAMHLDAAALWLADPDGELALVHSAGLHPDEAKRLAAWKPPEVATLRRTPHTTAGVAAKLRPGLHSISGFARSLVVPLRSGLGDVVGLLALGTSRDRRFSEADHAFAGAVAEHLVVALDHARQLQREARTDFLTGLANRQEFERSVTRHIAAARRSRRPLTLALLDLDNLKTINDGLGHHAGDSAIRAVGEALRRAVRASDVSARLGGDEFGVSLPDLNVEQAAEVANRIRESLRVNPAVAALSVPVAVSVGFAPWREGMEWPELFRQADRALYRDKRRRSKGAGHDYAGGSAQSRYAART